MKGLWYLFAAFLVVWIGLWAYVLRMAARQRALRAQIEDLKAATERGAADAAREE